MLFGEEHVKRYQATDGAEGHDWEGTTTLLLTTTGRKSGEQRTTPLIYQRHGDEVMVVASNGGNDNPPLWYLNLQADPQATVQVRGDKYKARARTATAAEKTALWKTMVEAWPAYNDYQAQTSREIPIVVLERA
jgi:deazaflavin-dependent oxidoreductase (nitroreductase family)